MVPRVKTQPEPDWQAMAWKLQHRWNELIATRVGTFPSQPDMV